MRKLLALKIYKTQTQPYFTTKQFIARYCDYILKSPKAFADSEMDTCLKGVMTVFKFVEDKDVFQTFYTKYLARRLVNNSSTSDDAESSMISRLKVLADNVT